MSDADLVRILSELISLRDDYRDFRFALIGRLDDVAIEAWRVRGEGFLYSVASDDPERVRGELDAARRQELDAA